jgi:hypothetical protein
MELRPVATLGHADLLKEPDLRLHSHTRCRMQSSDYYRLSGEGQQPCLSHVWGIPAGSRSLLAGDDSHCLASARDLKRARFGLTYTVSTATPFEPATRSYSTSMRQPTGKLMKSGADNVKDCAASSARGGVFSWPDCPRPRARTVATAPLRFPFGCGVSSTTTRASMSKSDLPYTNPCTI